MRRYTILTLFFFLTGLPLLAQEETPEELYDDGEYFYYREEYEEAAYLFRQVLKEEPGNGNVLYMLGMSYLNIPGQEDQAIPMLEEAVNYIAPNHRKTTFASKEAPQYAWFYLGNAYRIDNQLDKALEAYNTFRNLRNFEKHYNVKIVENEVKAVERAKIIKDAPVEITAWCLEEPINSPQDDYCGVISANEKVLIWVNSQKFYEAIMMSIKQDGKWIEPVNITSQVGSDGDLFPTGLSADGTELYLIRRGAIDSDIYYSRFDGSLWSTAVPLSGEVNSNYTEDFASVSADGTTLLLSSNRPGSLGGLDLFYSMRQPDGTWGKPVAFGEPVNTENDESYPYLSPDDQTLYFSSKGHYNMGGYDVFYSRINADRSLSLPVNIGFPINTTGDNTGFVPLKDGISGLYSRYTRDGIGNEDLWMIELVPFKNLIARSLTRLSDEDFTIELTGDDGEKITLRYDAVKDVITVVSENGSRYSVVYSKEE